MLESGEWVRLEIQIFWVLEDGDLTMSNLEISESRFDFPLEIYHTVHDRLLLV